MLTLYWALLITGVLFAIVSVLFGDLLSSALDGPLDFLWGDHLHALQPTVVLSGLTACGGAGILLTRYTWWGSAAILITAITCAVAASILVYLFCVKPMQNSENSVAYSMQDLVGRAAEVSVPIPAEGYGEVVMRVGAGNTNHIAASYDKVDIGAGTKVVTVEVIDGTLFVTCLDTEV
ncbi:protease [Paenibacillus xerothermodurans]|uniref:Protease n=2 Tax=Paenibacillus xerothermodurans TaxID=1977292 RepID=A0A2W1NGG9_PAEXE|nr:protease [Paenibacillus xerothermodurans]PZE22181.1 protease [Paenibacillus xerothermodurans]